MKNDFCLFFFSFYSASSINYKIIDACVNPVVTLICSCCGLEIHPSTFMAHLKFMAKKQWNKKVGSFQPTWDGWFRRFDMQFLKSKVVFGNGLVLYNQNLIRTDIGHYDDFKQRAEQLFKSLKK